MNHIVWLNVGLFIVSGLLRGPALIGAAISNLECAQAIKLAPEVQEASRLRVLEPVEGGEGYRSSGNQNNEQRSGIPVDACPMKPALEAVADGRISDAASALMRAKDRGAGLTRSLDAILQAEETQTETLWWAVPPGLAEFEYGLAVRAAEAGDWGNSLEHFQQAVSYRSGPWPSEFYERYEEVIDRMDPQMAGGSVAAENTVVDRSAMICVGRRDQPGWVTPIEVERGWRLEGFGLRDWNAVNWGLPLIADYFWLDPSGQQVLETVRTWNLVPNGGFELGFGPLSGQGRVLGWSQSTDRFEGFVAPAWHRLVRQDQLSIGLVSPPSQIGYKDYVMVSRIIEIPQGVSLVWSAWVDNTDGGNPHIFSFWLDDQGRVLETEILLQGSTPTTGRTFAGVITPPPGVSHMRLILQNWRAPGQVVWDNVLILRLPAVDIEGQRR